MRHLMCDIETMNDRSFAAILSISAVQFDIVTGELGQEFHVPITLQSNMDAGLTLSAKTIMWWLQKDESARRKLCDAEKNGKPLGLALYEFRKFIEDLHAADLQVWGNSNRFDFGILANAYHAFKQEHPWKHTLERDVRTLVSLAPQFKRDEPFVGIAHDGIDDCKHQIKYLVKTYNSALLENKRLLDICVKSLEKIASYKHLDTSCSLEAQVSCQEEFIEKSTQDYFATIAKKTLSQLPVSDEIILKINNNTLQKNDQRYILAKERLESCTTEELQRILDNLDITCWDTFHFDKDNKTFCPIAIAMNLHNVLNNPTNEEVKEQMKNRFGVANIFKGTPGNFYTTNRKEDMINLCTAIINSR